MGWPIAAEAAPANAAPIGHVALTAFPLHQQLMH